jgi:NAD(P)-dependent dehydrogenase (short-subunit alcohol dehydrogenase family)
VSFTQSNCLQGRIALVTGAASGIGRVIVHSLADAGAAVIVADRHGDAAHAVVNELIELGHSAIPLIVELEEEDSVRQACANAVQWAGAPWILVNNAGIQNRAPLLETTRDFWNKNLEINLRGAFFMTRELGRAMIDANQGGRIVNICSLGLRSPMVPGLAAYAASKGALRSFTMSTAFEFAEYGITANAVLPGGVATPGAMAATGTEPSGPGLRVPPLGHCTSDDIAAAVSFLVSPAAARITNQAITVDGGFLLT